MTNEPRRHGHGSWAGLDYAWAIDIGLQRDRNEDALDVRELALPDQRSGLVLAVADGLGGGNGDKASRAAIGEIRACGAHWEAGAGRLPLKAARQDLEAAFLRADARIRDGAATDRERPGATTLVVALVIAGWLIHLYVGDSRLYLIGPEGVVHRTRDQTLAQVQIDTKRIRSEAEATPRQRNTLFSVLGGDRKNVSIEPEWRVAPPVLLPFRPGQTLLLCTDGLWGQIELAALQALVADRGLDLPAVCAHLLERVYAAGAPDNIAMILVRPSG